MFHSCLFVVSFHIYIYIHTYTYIYIYIYIYVVIPVLFVFFYVFLRSFFSALNCRLFPSFFLSLFLCFCCLDFDVLPLLFTCLLRGLFCRSVFPTFFSLTISVFRSFFMCFCLLFFLSFFRCFFRSLLLSVLLSRFCLEYIFGIPGTGVYTLFFFCFRRVALYSADKIGIVLS